MKQRDAVGYNEDTEAVIYINGITRIYREVAIMKRLLSEKKKLVAESQLLPRRLSAPVRSSGPDKMQSMSNDLLRLEESTSSSIGLSKMKQRGRPAPTGPPVQQASNARYSSPTDRSLSPSSEMLLQKSGAGGRSSIRKMGGSSALLRRSVMNGQKAKNGAECEGSKPNANMPERPTIGFSSLTMPSLKSLTMEKPEKKTAREGSTNICYVCEVIDDKEEDDTVSIVMDLAEHGPLMKFEPQFSRFNANPVLGERMAGFDITRCISSGNYSSFPRCDGLTKETVYSLTGQLLSAVAFLHQNGVAHRDIKPENILIDKNRKLRLADFGSAEMFDIPNQSTSSISKLNYGYVSHTVGTMAFWAPEMVECSIRDTLDAGDKSTHSEMKENKNTQEAKTTSTQSERKEEQSESKKDYGILSPQKFDRDARMDSNGSDSKSSPRLPAEKDFFSVFAGDMWACGIVLHCLLFHQAPFTLIDENRKPKTPLQLFEDAYNSRNANSMLSEKKISSDDKDLIAITEYIEWSNELVNGLLAMNPADRLTSTGAIDLYNTITLS